MRFLANENFPYDAIIGLRNNGHDVVWIRTESPAMSDKEILEWAQKEDRIVIRFDKDFSELAFRFKLPSKSGIILFRISAPSSEYVAKATVAAIESQEDWGGYFSVVEDNRVRMTPLPGSQ